MRADATNIVPVSTIKAIPYELMFGRKPHSTSAPLAVAAPTGLVHEKDLRDLLPGQLGPLGQQVAHALSHGPDSVSLQRLGVAGTDSLCSLLAILAARNAAYSLVTNMGMPFRSFDAAAQLSFARGARGFLASTVTADAVAACNAAMGAGVVGTVDVASLQAALGQNVALDERHLAYVSSQLRLNVFIVESCTQMQGDLRENRVTFLCVQRFDHKLPSVALFCRHHVTVTDLSQFVPDFRSSPLAIDNNGHFEALVDEKGIGEWPSDHVVVQVLATRCALCSAKLVTDFRSHISCSVLSMHVLQKLARLTNAADPDLGFLNDPRYEHRAAAKQSQIAAGDKMIARSEDKSTTWLPSLGDVVGVRLTDKHRAQAPLGVRVLAGVVVEIKDHGYRVRCESDRCLHGVLVAYLLFVLLVVCRMLTCAE